MQRRRFLASASAFGAWCAGLGRAAAVEASAEPVAGKRKPNFIVILCDDLGYGDIEPTGGRTIPTPALNRMARDASTVGDTVASLP